LLNNEEWREIARCPGYEVSSLGRIRSAKTGRIKTTKPDDSGYVVTNIRNSTVSVHREMAIAFIPNPANKPTVNHDNGVKTDNRLDHFSWMTHTEQMEHAYRLGLSKPVDWKVHPHPRGMAGKKHTAEWKAKYCIAGWNRGRMQQ
jgi:hypothetical protein